MKSLASSKTAGVGTVGIKLKICKLEKKVDSEKMGIWVENAGLFDDEVLRKARSWVKNASIRYSGFTKPLRKFFFHSVRRARDGAMVSLAEFDLNQDSNAHAVRDVVLPAQIQRVARRRGPGFGSMPYLKSFAYVSVVPSDNYGPLAQSNTFDTAEDNIVQTYLEEDNGGDALRRHRSSVKILVHKTYKELSKMYETLKRDGKVSLRTVEIIVMTPAFPFPAEVMLPITYDGEDDGKIPCYVLKYEDGFDFSIPVQGLVASKGNIKNANFIDSHWEINEAIMKVKKSDVKEYEEHGFSMVEPIAGEKVSTGYVLVGHQVLQKYDTVVHDPAPVVAEKDVTEKDVGPSSSQSQGGCIIH